MLALLHCWFFESSTEYIHVHIGLFCIYSLMSLSIFLLFDLQLFVINYLSLLTSLGAYCTFLYQVSWVSRKGKYKWKSGQPNTVETFQLTSYVSSFTFFTMLCFLLCNFISTQWCTYNISYSHLRVHRHPLMCSCKSQLY